MLFSIHHEKWQHRYYEIVHVKWLSLWEGNCIETDTSSNPWRRWLYEEELCVDESDWYLCRYYFIDIQLSLAERKAFRKASITADTPLIIIKRNPSPTPHNPRLFFLSKLNSSSPLVRRRVTLLPSSLAPPTPSDHCKRK